MAKLVKTNRGANLKIGIHGDEIERERWMNFFYNRGATNAVELLETGQYDFGFLCISEENFLRVYTNFYADELADVEGSKYKARNKSEKRKNGLSFYSRCKEMARKRLESLEEENFLIYLKSPDESNRENHIYVLGVQDGVAA